MQMTITEARLFIDSKERDLKDTLANREKSSTNVSKLANGKKELVHAPHEYNVDAMTALVAKLQCEIRKLRLLVTKANVDTILAGVTGTEAEPLTLQEGIYLIKQLREDALVMRRLGDMKEHRQVVDPLASRYGATTADRSYEQVSEPTFNTRLYREREKSLDRYIHNLEMAITHANLTTFIDVPFIDEDATDMAGL